MKHFLLLVILAGETHAFFQISESHCNATQNASTCSASLGGSVYIQLMTNASNYLVECVKKIPRGSMKVFTLKKGKVTIDVALRNRAEFFIYNGTLKITSLEKNDSGLYSVEVFDNNGMKVKSLSFLLNLDDKEFLLRILILVCIAVGALLILILLICCCVCRKRRSQRRITESKDLWCEGGLL
ncbi:uncharacterized protein si:zfos-741a10.3 [Cololabis saira]|uniref:uncharacterized protein si:zfos-741a10.3 n=1 Tax=Cololabis saira TaxID=129043 RepID=UPI002AD2B328|nr:uncharacterized protein si:zfos-741a10.3 [Cololabis saira]